MMMDHSEHTWLPARTAGSSGYSDWQRGWRRVAVLSLAATPLLLLVGLLPAQEKKEPPQAKVVAPFGIVRGTTTTVIIRGLNLSDATEIRFPDLKPAPVIKIKSKGAAPGADKVSVDKIGNTQLEVELTLPPDAPLRPVPFIIVGPSGQSEAKQILILDETKTVAEKEPNDGFAGAQEISLGQSITGILSPGQKSDVFRFTGQAGQKIRIEAQAVRFGSPLDPFLILNNADGQLLAEVDDGLEVSDPILEFTFAKDGAYFLTIRDAHDLASPVHAYVLRTKVQ